MNAGMLKLVVVDGEEQVRSLLQGIFVRVGYEVQTVPAAEEALKGWVPAITSTPGCSPKQYYRA